jgi:hypothetical protein
MKHKARRRQMLLKKILRGYATKDRIMRAYRAAQGYL